MTDDADNVDEVVLRKDADVRDSVDVVGAVGEEVST